MIISEMESHLSGAGYAFETINATGGDYLVIQKVEIAGGPHAGKICDIAVKRTAENPWVPDSCIHVRPHLVPMGQRASQPSPIGADWQYLSRRFDRAPSPKAFLAHLLTVVGEL